MQLTKKWPRSGNRAVYEAAVFRRGARRHIADIFSYINDRNPAAATQVVTRIRLAAERLAEFPRIGHTGRVPGTYEWVVRSLPYIVVYDISLREDEIVILGVFHGAQDRDAEQQ